MGRGSTVLMNRYISNYFMLVASLFFRPCDISCRINSNLVIHRQVKISDIISRRFGDFMTSLSRVQMSYNRYISNYFMLVASSSPVKLSKIVFPAV